VSYVFAARQSFTVPATNGQYASEEIVFAPSTVAVVPSGLLGGSAVIEKKPASASLELWLLQVEGDPTNAADWFYSGNNVTAANALVTWPLASYPGAKLRAKSGGTSGSLVADASAD